MNSRDLRILGFGVFDSRKKFDGMTLTPKRQVTLYEIELFCADGGVSVVNGVAHQIKKGNVLIAHPGDERQSKLHFSCHYLHFEIQDEEAERLLRSLSQFIEYDLSDGILPIFQKYENTVPFDPDFKSVFEAEFVLELICKIKTLEKEISLDAALSDGHSPISKAVAFMNRHYGVKIGVADIARHVGFSASHFHKIFCEATGVTPNRYLNGIRIAHAKKMLTTGEPIAAVAESCGFSSPNYFHYCFTKTVGISPKKYCDGYHDGRNRR